MKKKIIVLCILCALLISLLTACRQSRSVCDWTMNDVIPLNGTIETWNNPISKYADVQEGTWYHDSVQYVATHGLMNGVGGNLFDPEGTVTRGMLVTILYRLEGSPQVIGASSFEDVKKGSYYEKAVIWATNKNVVNGYSKTKFGPDDRITREQVATILYRYTQTKGVSIDNKETLASFSDKKDVSSYAQEAVRWAVAEGLINGLNDTILAPKGQTTRAQIATIIMRYEGTVKNEPADNSKPGTGNSEPNNNTSTESNNDHSNNTTEETGNEMTAPNIIVNSVTVKPGDPNVEVTVTIKNNPGILGMTLSVLYDDSVLALTDAANGAAVKQVLTMTKPGKFLPQCRFTWDGQDISEEDIKDGTILTLRFSIAEDAAEGVYPIEVAYNTGDIVDNELSPVTVLVSNGSVIISK